MSKINEGQPPVNPLADAFVGSSPTSPTTRNQGSEVSHQNIRAI